MAIPKTVCKACRQGLNWELCGVEEKNPCTLCIERREECKSTLPSRQLDRLPTVSAYPNIQFPPNQTPSHPGAQISSLPSASDGSYSSYTLRPIHPGMPIAGSVQLYSGLGGHQYSDARASTVRQSRRSQLPESQLFQSNLNFQSLTRGHLLMIAQTKIQFQFSLWLVSLPTRATWNNITALLL